MNIKTTSILFIGLLLLILLDEYYDNDTQTIVINISRSGQPISGAAVAILKSENTCIETMELFNSGNAIGLLTSNNGIATKRRTVPDPFFKNYDESLRVCINTGKGWKQAWEASYPRVPGQLPIFCYDIKSNDSWICRHYCLYCDNDKLDRDFWDTNKELLKQAETYQNKIIKAITVEVKLPIKANLTGKIIDYGIYDMVKKSSSSTESNLMLQSNFNLLNVTNDFKIIKNQGIGFRYEISKFSPYAKKEFEVIIHHPAMTNEKGDELKVDKSVLSLPDDYGIFEADLIYFFEKDYEMVSGVWKFQVLDRDKVLLEKEFYVSQ